MKPALACLLLLAPAAHAQIFADVSTTLGEFTIQLDHLNSPRVVANFIRLAEGSTPWVDEDTGIVQFNRPFYNGIIFHRVIKDFMSQTGSPRGDGSDGPGYTFRDEVDNGVAHAVHSVSMANSGPNTNGSQFFITDVATSWLNGKHTVFGSISAGGTIVDAINDTPVTGSLPITPVVIQSITIRRVGAAALAFDEHAQMLPVVTAPSVTVQHDGSGASLLFAQAARSHAWCYHSPDLADWSPVERFLDAQAAPATMLDLSAETAGQPRQFFATSVVGYPADGLFPGSLSNRTLATATPLGNFTFVFDAGGGGTWSLDNPPLSGGIADYIYEPDPYGAVLLMALDGINYPYVRHRLGYDTASPTLLSGRQTGLISTSYSGLFGSANGTTILALDGTFTLTR